MNITIQINDEKSVSLANGAGKGSGSSETTDEETSKDGGAPAFSADTAGEDKGGSSPSLDIGGPPAWLTEQINQGKSITSSEPTTDAAGGQQTDAGAAPEF